MVSHVPIASLIGVEIVDIQSCSFRTYLPLFGPQIMLGLECRLVEEYRCFLVAASNQACNCLKASYHLNVRLLKLKL